MVIHKSSGFVDALKKAGSFAINPLLEIEDDSLLGGGRVGHMLERTLEEMSSPVSLLSMALAPVTGGASVGFRSAMIGGQAAKIAAARGIGSKLAQSVALEGAASAGAVGAPKLVEAAGIDNQYAQMAAGLVAGFGAPAALGRSTAVKSSIDKALNKEALFRTDPTAANRAASVDPRMGYGDPDIRREPGYIAYPGVKYQAPDANYSAGKRSLLDAIDSEVAEGSIPEGAGIITKSALEMIPAKYLEDLTTSFTSRQQGFSPTALKGQYHYKRLPDGMATGPGAKQANDLNPAALSIYRTAIQDDASATVIFHEITHHLQTFISKADNELLDAEFQLERLRFAPDDFGGDRLYASENYRWSNFGEWFAEKLVDKTMDDVYRTASPELRSAIERGTAMVRAWVTAVAEYLGATGRTDLMDDVYRKIKSGEYDVNTRSQPWEDVIQQSAARVSDLDPVVIKGKADQAARIAAIHREIAAKKAARAAPRAGVESSSYSTTPENW